MLRTLLMMMAALWCLAAPADASPRYKAYAEGLLKNLPDGAVIRPDLEQELNRLAASARSKAGKPPLKASQLLVKAARAQAVEMILGNFVGHTSKSGFRYRNRFEAFGGDV